MKVAKISRLEFKKEDGQILELNIPPDLNQDSVKFVNFKEYSIWLVRPNRAIAEAEFCKVCLPSGETVGCIIPGTAILSGDNPNRENTYFGAYSLAIAVHICQNSHNGDYSLAGYRHGAATNATDIFAQDCYYLAIWKTKLPHSHQFTSRYAISLAAAGLVLCNCERSPNSLPIIFSPKNNRINIRSSCNKYPSHISIILAELIPFTENPFLRFFYLYQIVEYLMSEVYDTKVQELRTQLGAAIPPSLGDMKDWLNAFSSATNEDARIKDVISTNCPELAEMIERLLDSIGVDHTRMLFPQKIYKLRNILFHEYSRVHNKEADLKEISDRFYKYLLETKIVFS